MQRRHSHQFPYVLCLLSLALWGSVPLAQAAKCPNLQLVLDQSTSMNVTLGPSSRTAIAKAAFTQALTSYAGKLPIGLNIFPTGSVACGGSTRAAIAPSMTSKSAIQSALSSVNPDGSSALGDGLQVSYALMELKDPARRQHVIAITDGIPNCGPDQPQTLALVQQALMQTPSVTTHFFVFDTDLTAAEKTYMNSLAVAGGSPEPGTTKYVAIKSETQLKLAVQALVEGLLVGCDETCYAEGCKLISESCIRGECRPNPCAGVSCPADSYCFTDGVSSGTCVHACTSTCTAGTRCRGGDCVVTPCSGPCPAGTVCNAAAHRCEPDPLCGTMTCPGSSACMAGTCVDDPCTLIRCPAKTRCVPWEGSCEYAGIEPADAGTSSDGGANLPDLSGTPGLQDGGSAGQLDLWGFSAPGAGCETTSGPSATASVLAQAAAGLVLLLGLLWRRSRGNRNSGSSVEK